MATEPCWMSLVDAADALRRRELSATELLDATLARIDAHEPKLNAFAVQLRDAARHQAERADEELGRGDVRGPLQGIPIAIKDLCFTKGVPTASGTTVMADYEPGIDATVVEKLDGAGAVIVGKTMLTEGATGEHHPDLVPPANPWSLEHWTGVSSSGSGSAVAAGFCFGALGSDTGGSIRFPSAACGLTGIKPTRGRVSRYGVFPLSTSLDHVGPMTRSAADAAALLQGIAGHDPRDPTSLLDSLPDFSDGIDAGVTELRIGVDEAFCTEFAAPEVSAGVLEAAEQLEALGAVRVPVQVPSWQELATGWSIVCGADVAIAHADTFPSRADEYGPGLRALIESGLRASAVDYARVQEHSRIFSGRLDALFDSIDLLVCPSMPMLPPSLEVMRQILEAGRGAVEDGGTSTFLKFTAPFDFSGSPTISLPCGFSDEGLPKSVQLIGRHLDEATLCRAGFAYQRETDWHLRRPPLVP